MKKKESKNELGKVKKNYWLQKCDLRTKNSDTNLDFIV
jgi:hypothetical protein